MVATRKNPVRDRQRDNRLFSPQRVEALSDGVIAIAITFLTLEIHIPTFTEHASNAEIWSGLSSILPQLAALVLSFIVIAQYWTAHMRLMRDVTAVDARFVGLNSVFLLWIVLMPLSTNLISEHGDTPLTTIIYALNLALAGYWLALMWRRLQTHPELHSKEDVEEDLRQSVIASLYVPIIFSLSIFLAVKFPAEAKFFWLFIIFNRFVTPIFYRLRSIRPSR